MDGNGEVQTVAVALERSVMDDGSDTEDDSDVVSSAEDDSDTLEGSIVGSVEDYSDTLSEGSDISVEGGLEYEEVKYQLIGPSTTRSLPLCCYDLEVRPPHLSSLCAHVLEC
jgi:hypothetical protein